jgi:hypothetical protein
MEALEITLILNLRNTWIIISKTVIEISRYALQCLQKEHGINYIQLDERYLMPVSCAYVLFL